MKSVAAVIHHAEEHCKANGSRLTEKRKHVLTGLIKSDKALSAYELIDFCRNEFGETIPAMSVYRILVFLQNEKLVHKLNLANKFVACAHITCDHAHGVPQFLICNQCHKVSEINIEKSTIETLKNSVQAAGFHLVTPQIELNCVCETCLSAAA
ncbi:Fur family transcriptional regulator [Enterovibrio calviensis]|uniref:Fur family transcriptional regulator n=1 Tax=Enterovibrio calviensis TaxID=91359 RepID=UPI003735A27D